MAQKSPPAAPPTHTFESAIERLEALVEQMEGDKLPLEQLIERYEEGSGLVKVCQEKLEAAERRIEIITRQASGKPQVTEFEPAGVSSPAAAVPSGRPSAETDDDAGGVSLF